MQVFLLAGQSNMEGKGAVRHLETLARDPATRVTFGRLATDDGWVVRDDVWISYRHRPDDVREGGLTVGYGSRKDQIGPELGFGTVVGDGLDAPVLLVKCAWGGASLKEDFLPPGSGGPGGHYTRMLAETRAVLDDLGAHVPGYRGQGYVLAGFVWFQGWNDAIGAGNPDYTAQLVQLVRDVREAFGVPELPVVIGELGQAGPDPKEEKVLRFRAQQRAAAEALGASARYVETGVFIDPRLPRWFEVWRKCDGLARKAESEEAKAAAWAEWNEVKDDYERVASDRPYHYYGSGRTFYLIGDAFGRAMLELLDGK